MERVNKILNINLLCKKKKKKFEIMNETPVCIGLGSKVGNAGSMKDRAALGHREQRAMKGGGKDLCPDPRDPHPNIHGAEGWTGHKLAEKERKGCVEVH